MAQDLEEVRLGGAHRHLPLVQSRRRQPHHIRDLDARQVLQRDDAGAGVGPGHHRRLHPIHFAEIASEPVSIAALPNVVDLLVEDGAALLVDALEVAAALVLSVQQCRHPPQLRQVDVEQILEAGALHFDDHLGAVPEGGPVHLPQAGCGQRPLVKGSKQHFRRSAQLCLDDGSHPLHRKRRHPILQLGKLLGELRGEQVRPGREQLPDLDEGGSQLQNGAPQPPRCVPPPPRLRRLREPTQI
mmetsp:Transcript_3030/g.8846  ORF Transcript_3030/g.8846 Transcript_3030/m.8846 type:complete len:243 (+) Transcript_3030:900-1628(+)